MFKLRIALPAAILAGGFLLCTTASYGTADMAKQTKKACKYCHVQAMPKKGDAKSAELTDAGKYYKEHKSFDGYVEKK